MGVVDISIGVVVGASSLAVGGAATFVAAPATGGAVVFHQSFDFGVSRLFPLSLGCCCCYCRI